MKWLRVRPIGQIGYMLVNADDVSQVAEYSGSAYITMRSMTQTNTYYSVSSASTSSAPMFQPVSFQVQETLADIEMQLGLRQPVAPNAFSLDELEAAQEQINGHAPGRG